MEDLTEIRKIIETNALTLKRLEVAILGDERAGIKGLASQMKEHEVAIKDYLDNKNKFLGVKQVLILIGSGIVAFLTTIFTAHK